MRLANVVATTRETLDQRSVIAARKAAGIETLLPTPGLNVAFTYSGLVRLGVAGLDGNTSLDAFVRWHGGAHPQGNTDGSPVEYLAHFEARPPPAWSVHTWAAHIRKAYPREVLRHVARESVRSCAGGKPLLHFSRFVLMQGGEYFFAPSITAVKSL